MCALVSTKSEEAYRILRRKIEGGELNPGDRVSEVRLSKELGLRRGPIRESLLRLEAEGLLKGRGAYGGRYVEYIEDQKPEDVVHRYEVREVVEGQAARLAALNMTGLQIKKLQELHREMEEVLRGNDREKSYETSHRFHAYLMSRCGNPILFNIWTSYRLMPLSQRSPDLESKIEGNVANESEHTRKLAKVVEAISTHDPDAAERYMREFVSEITDAIRRTKIDEEDGF